MAKCPFCGKKLIKASNGYRHQWGQANGCLGASQYNRNTRTYESGTANGCGCGVFILLVIIAFWFSTKLSNDTTVMQVGTGTPVTVTPKITVTPKTTVTAKPTATISVSASRPTLNVTATPKLKLIPSATATPRLILTRTLLKRTPIPASSPKLPVPIKTSLALDSLSYQEIEKKYEALSSREWKKYRDGLIGTQVHWIGTVKKVSREYLTVNVGQQRSSYWVYLDEVPKNTIESLSEDQKIEFRGTIYKFEWFLGLDVHLHDIEVID